MLFLSKQVSLPNISLILQKVKIGPKSDVPLFAQRPSIGSYFWALKENTNPMLTERKGHTGEYWPEVVPVQTKRSEVHTKMTNGQYSPVWLKLARLVSSLLYGVPVMLPCFLLKNALLVTWIQRTSAVFLMTQATRKEQATMSLKTNLSK